LRLLSIIILNYKGWQDTIDCLISLNRQSFKDFHIILIDNGSGDDSYDKIQEWLTKNRFYTFLEHDNNKEEVFNPSANTDIFLIKCGQNHGFAKGNNIGIGFSKYLETKYCLLLNNDTTLDKNAILKLVEFKKCHPEFSALTSQIRYFDPNDIIWNCGGFIYPFATRKYLYPGDKIENIPQTGFKKITLLTGCVLFYDPFESGLLSEKFFFGEEDFEFSLRMRKHKKKMAVVFDSIIFHKVGASRGESKKAIESVYIHYLNRFIDLKSYYSKVIWFLYVLINSSYAIFMVTLKYDLQFIRSLKLFKKIISDSRRLDGVNKKLFQDVFFEKKLNY